MSNDIKRETAHPHAAASLDPARLAELQRANRTVTEGETDGVAWKLSRPFNPDAPRYPNVNTHLWGAWPFLAIEMEGYGDLSAHDASTGMSFWAQCFTGNAEDDPAAPYDAMRKLVDLMQAADFFGRCQEYLNAGQEPPVSR